MRRSSRVFVMAVCAVASPSLAVYAYPQQPAASATQQLSPNTALEPLVVDDGKHSGDVVLIVNLDATGTISDVTRTTGDPSLVPFAMKFAKVLRNSQLANTNDLTEHVTFLNGTAIKKVAPVYPPIARAAHVSGTVMVAASVASDGHVTEALAIAGPPMLKGSAEQAVRQWTFPPQESNGSPVNFRALITVSYELH
jgi:TonB family protein